MIRVCFLVDPPFLGGAEAYVSALATGLDRARFEPSLIMREVEDDALNAWADDLVSAGVPVTRVTMRLPSHPGDALGVMRALERVAPQVAHVNVPGPYDGQNGLLLPIARLCGARTLVTEHLPMVPRTPRRGLLKAFAYRWLDLAVTMTQSNQESLRVVQGVAARRIRVVANGVSEHVAAPERGQLRSTMGAREGDVLVLYVGNILEHKGLHRLIEALSMCSSPTWRLGVIGDGPQRALAERTAARCRVSDRVVFLGRRSEELVREALGVADLLALPSRWEGLPYVILEAMAAGLPVVSTSVFGIPEVVTDGETGLLVPPDDVPALSRALDALIGDATRRRRMGDAGRARYLASFTLKRQIDSMSAIYSELARGSA